MACIMRQVVYAQRHQLLARSSCATIPARKPRCFCCSPSMPLGVLLPYGLTWQIDNGGKPILSLSCSATPQLRNAACVINEAYVNSLKQGGMLKLTAKNRAASTSPSRST